ncbi:hypothetical protein BKA82DRAFT_996857 [Pisolithus tinctorius]|uniref:Uncharacterized protein n=1 Tax=Pisolithus tinctorius Marx 270 TaxID=870435 RepID=A0A0C3PLQ0_PISTI|nr:hypothetical protein BKA82DRAFT_996857 [Pisolithus tinctorius]KIO09229.1 hypothetical protein M404DRAFT_996857 [Pisolithus tinctorius Marx 270]
MNAKNASWLERREEIGLCCLIGGRLWESEGTRLRRTKSIGLASPLDPTHTRSRMSDALQVLKLLSQSLFVTNAMAIPRNTVCSPDPAMRSRSSCGKLAMPPLETGLVGKNMLIATDMTSVAIHNYLVSRMK